MISNPRTRFLREGKTLTAFVGHVSRAFGAEKNRRLFKFQDGGRQTTGPPRTAKFWNESEMLTSSERTACHHPTGKSRKSPGSRTTSTRRTFCSFGKAVKSGASRFTALKQVRSL